MSELFLEGKHFFALQKESLRLTLAEKVTLLATWLCLTLVCFVLGTMVLFFLSMALATWLGSITTPACGYVLVAMLIAVILYIVYRQRQEWIVNPIANMMTQIFAPEKEEETNHDDSNQPA